MGINYTNMGARGPQKLPQEVLDLRGTSRADRDRSIIQGKKLTSVDQIIGYDQLKKLSARGKRIFKNKCAQLIGLNMLEDTYLDMLFWYAYYYDQALDSIEKIKESGGEFNTKFDNNGHIAGFLINPYANKRDESIKKMLEIGSKFGFTPVDRQKLTLQVEKKDPLSLLKAALVVDAEDVEEL